MQMYASDNRSQIFLNSSDNRTFATPLLGFPLIAPAEQAPGCPYLGTIKTAVCPVGGMSENDRLWNYATPEKWVWFQSTYGTSHPDDFTAEEYLNAMRRVRIGENDYNFVTLKGGKMLPLAADSFSKWREGGSPWYVMRSWDSDNLFTARHGGRGNIVYSDGHAAAASRRAGDRSGVPPLLRRESGHAGQLSEGSKMRRFLILFLAVCTGLRGMAAPRITPDGEILCGPLRLRLAWFDGEWRMTGQERGTVFPAPGYPLEQPELFELEGTLRLFHDAGELRLTERVELLPGALKYRAALRGKPGMPCRSAALFSNCRSRNSAERR